MATERQQNDGQLTYGHFRFRVALVAAKGAKTNRALC